jgi:preprotein translocase subunit SecG
MTILIGILTFVLILVSVFLVLIVLAQKAKSDGGMGSALGGGAAEAAFGGETGNVLSKATINAAIVFFVLAFGLYLGRIYQRKHAVGPDGGLPVIPGAVVAPAAATPVATPGVAVPATTTTTATTAPAAATATPAATSPAPAKQP